jgi:flagellin-like hook-associated protein FlgL
MAQVINTNIPSLNAQRNLNTSQTMLSSAPTLVPYKTVSAQP